MKTTDLLAYDLAGSIELLKKSLADFSDADLLVRPTPGANHAAWQLGHLVNAEVGLVNAVAPGAVPAPPGEFSNRFTKETAKSDDPATFPSKDEILRQLTRTRTATVTWVKGLSDADLEKPGPERMRSVTPTVAHLASMLASHVAMHLGQIQVIRRKLGKPVLF